MPSKHGPQIKDAAVYEALRSEGASAGKAARIANASAAGTIDHSHGGQSLETRTRAELMTEARKVGIAGRSRMRKAELVGALRGS